MKTAVLVLATLSATLIQPTPCQRDSIPAPLPSDLTLQPVRLDVIARSPAPSRHVQRWENFESEFGIRDRDRTPLRYPVAQLKYGIDTATFGMAEFLNDVNRALDFEWDDGHFQQTSDSPAHKSRSNPRLKFDVALNGSKPYLGIRVVMPFGD